LRVAFRITIFITPLLILSACITTSDLLKQKPSTPAKFSLSDFNGDYLNDNDSSEYGVTLWQALFFCKTFKNDTTRITKTSVVNLSFSDNKLIVCVGDAGVTRNKIELKAKLKGDHITVKRNLFLIPIPFIWYRYHEAKAVLSKTPEGKLLVNYARSQFVWTLMAGSVDQNFDQTHKKIK
jgi:hypothetical protein